MKNFLLSYKKILIFFYFNLIFSSNVFSTEPYFVNSESLERIPAKYLTFLEGFDENTPYDVLENSMWSKKLINAQSIVDGYWVKLVIINELENNELGLNHNFNREKKIFIKNSNGIKDYPYWKWGVNEQIEENRIGSQYLIKAPKNEETIIYNFFRSKPFDRFMSLENGLDRMMIGTWKKLRLKEILRIVGSVSFFTPALFFGFYFFFIYLVSKGDYIWISLTLFIISIILFLTFILRSFGVDNKLTSSNAMAVYIPMLFLFLIQFFRKSLNLEFRYPKINKIYLVGIIFYIIAIFVNLFSLFNSPNEEQLNLIKYPPDQLGPGIIKLRQLLVPFLILLLSSIIISFILWKKGSKSSGYLCLSFLLPFLALPISGLTYLIVDGFNWYFWSTVSTSTGFLLLSMFVTFGFSVAQNLNDLKQNFLNKQIELNEKLESDVKLRTLELTEANRLITQSINSASIIQNAILPKIDCKTYGFNEFEYIWEPRDIVGGDFYWLDKQNDWTSFVVADCTGHGIPGAFMTLISSTLLDRVKSLDDLSRPDVILNKLDELLESKLRLKENKTMEFGMDIGICSFSQKNKLLRFSGAKMNLYKIIGEIVNEFKGNKISIGYSEKPHPIEFKNHEIDLSENPNFYIFSDGVTDQVGGSKKLMYGKKRLLKHINQSTKIKTVIQNITDDFNDYQKDNNRRDDLSLFGFSIE